MPRLSDSGEEDVSLMETGRRHTKRFVSGFVDFAFSGNVLEIAFGLMYVDYQLLWMCA